MKNVVYLHREITYRGVQNDFCDHHVPHLTKLGFVLIEVHIAC